MPVDVHAHYVPPQLIAAIAARGKDIGVELVKSGDGPPALQFAYGFKVRPFFPRLIEPVRSGTPGSTSRASICRSSALGRISSATALPATPAWPGIGC